MLDDQRSIPIRENPRRMTIFIPCFNEEENILPLYGRVAAVIARFPFPAELLYTDNGSTDGTRERLERLSRRDPRVRVLAMSRNFGYQGAVSAGLAHATGEVVMVIDGDQQDPPELIPQFLDAWRKGADVVYGVREKRDAPAIRRLGYKFFYRLIQALSDVHIPRDASDFALMDRRVVDALNAMPERDRLVRGLRAYAGFRQAGIAYERPARALGATSFRLRDYVRFAYRSIYSYSYKPLELISLFAIFAVAVSLIGAAAYLALFFIQPDQPRGFFTLILAILFFGGVQLLSLAIIGEYVGRIFCEVKARPAYIVAERIGFEDRKGGQAAGSASGFREDEKAEDAAQAVRSVGTGSFDETLSIADPAAQNGANGARTRVVILCGGRGTRLHEETEFRPKPLVPVGGMPILWHIMKIYSHYGFKDFILCLGYRGDMIREYFLNFEEMTNDYTLNCRSNDARIVHHNAALEDWRITFVNTGLEASTGSRVARIEPYVRGQTFMLTYGDGVANVDIGKLLDFHRSKGKTLTLTGVYPESVFGIVEHADGVATSFKEKPRSDTTINGGFCVCEPEIFRYVSADDSCVFEQEPMRRLAADGQIAVYDHRDFWYCMDTHKHYLDLNKRWEQGDAPWKIWD